MSQVVNVVWYYSEWVTLPKILGWTENFMLDDNIVNSLIQ